MAAIHHATAKKAKTFGITLTMEEGDVVATKDGVRLASGLQGNKVLETAIGKLVETNPVTKAIAKVTGKTVVEIAKDGVKTRKAPATPKAPVVKSAAQEAAEDEAWKALRGGGFVQKIEGEEASYSEVTTWEELCEEQGIELEEPEANEEEEADESRTIIKDKYKKAYAQTAVKGTCGDDLASQLREYLTVETEDGPRIDRKKMKRFAEANGVWVGKYQNMKPGLVRMNVSNRLRAKVRKAEKDGGVFEIEWVA